MRWLGSLWRAEAPRFINLGDGLYAEYLGPGWSAAADGYRWLLGTGSLRIAAPRGPAERLYVIFFTDTEPSLAIRVEDTEVATQRIEHSNGMLTLAVSLPATLIGKQEINVGFSTASELHEAQVWLCGNSLS